jgi:hypothetical protein
MPFFFREGGGVGSFPPSSSARFLFIYLSFYFPNFVFYNSSLLFLWKQTKKETIGGKKYDGREMRWHIERMFIAPHTPRLLLLGGDLHVTDLSQWMRRASGTRKMGKFMFSHLSHFLGNSVICICCFTYADESAKM